MKRNQAEVVARLRMLYEKRGENQIFARMLVTLPGPFLRCIESRAERLSLEPFPAVEELAPLWEQYLAFFDALEDDWVPAIYPRQYDQGLYGTLFGARMELNRVGTPGWVSSNSRPLEGASYTELLELAACPRLECVARLGSDLRFLSTAAGGRWGVSLPITIDAFNLCMQIRGNQTMLDIYDCPDELKRFLQAGVHLNIELVERLQTAIDVEYAGGVYDFFNGGWMPGRAIPMSVDCYNMCSADIYAEFGLPYQQQLIDHFGGGNFHLHGNGRHLLPHLARLNGCVVCSIGNDGSELEAMDALESIKRQAGPVTPAVYCAKADFTRGLQERSLIGGTYYEVGPLETIDEANRLMEAVRRYRT